jgi:diguanylate cyclase (GGDEF)-like protein
VVVGGLELIATMRRAADLASIEESARMRTLGPVLLRASLPWLITGATAGLAALLFVTVGRGPATLIGGIDLPWWAMAAAWALAGVAVVHIHFRGEAHSVTLGEIPLVLGLLAARPEALLAGGLVGNALVLLVHRRQVPIKLAFNLAVFAVEAAVALGVFHALLGSHAAMSGVGWGAVFAGTLAASVVSSLLIALVVATTGGGGADQLRRLRAVLAFALPATALNTAIGLAGARLMWHDPMASAILVIPVVAVALTYRGYLAERAKHERMRLLYESIRAFQTVRGVDATIVTLLARAREMFDADVARLSLPALDEDGRNCFVLGPGDNARLVAEPCSDSETRLLGKRHSRVMPRGRRFGATAEYLERHGLRDAMLVAISGDGGVFGTLLVANRRSDVESFTSGDLALLEAFAGQAAASIAKGRLETELHDRAFHDGLTGLANRALLSLRLDAALQRTDRPPLGPAVLFLDLDDFKTVNDSLGHAVGDRLLTVVAERLRGCLRPSDTAARLGGDEFAILLDQVRAVSDASSVAERMIAALRAPFTVDGTRVLIHASIGVVIATPERTVADELLRDADIAMYRAKARGKGTWELFETSMQEQVRQRHLMKLDLERALENGELVVHYQPIVALATHAILGVESLLRWRHPRRGMVSPEDFVPLAEETGMISAIGRFVLRRSCIEAVQWSGMAPDFLLSVNLSGRQLRQEGFVAEVSSVLTETGFDASRLVLEITESVMVEDDEAVRHALLELKALSVRIAIDDFGTGYSSLSTLRDLPVDILKIAKPFIDGLGGDGDDGAFAAAIVRLGQTLGLDMIAEGIERREQVDELRPLLCGMGQGYLFARPMEGALFTQLLGRAAWRRDGALLDVEPGGALGEVVELFR